MVSKWVYFFGKSLTEGNRTQKELLGGKGANLADMTSLGVPVPPGLTITTDACAHYHRSGSQFPEGLEDQILDNVKRLEKEMGKSFGDTQSPLLVSVRSGAAVSMPGMMDTVLNLGMNDAVAESLAESTGNTRFSWDSYRRFIQMFSDVAMGVSHSIFEEILENKKRQKGVKQDTDLTDEDLKELVQEYKQSYQKEKGEEFPQKPIDQLWASVKAVFDSWNNPRAEAYRQMNHIHGLEGTAVNIQAMVFGNKGKTSATGVCFTRNPANGDKEFYGEYLLNAQGEDVVAGIRTPQQVTVESSKRWATENSVSEEVRSENFPSLEEEMPELFKELDEITEKLEKHYKDMQDIEFTIEDGDLYILQTRNGKRTAKAAVKIAVDMVAESMLSKEEALLKVEPDALDQLLHPIFDEKAPKDLIGKGLNASPGAAVGEVVFSADEAVAAFESGKKVILVRVETSPEDIKGMEACSGILTARGGATSHAAVVARGMGKCCVAGCSDLEISYADKNMKLNGHLIQEGDFISIDGSTGEIYKGQVALKEAEMLGDFATLMGWADEVRTMKVRTNADTGKDAQVALSFGAEGIGLCRTEHMFFEGDRIDIVREMIITDSVEGRQKALEKLLPIQRSDFVELFKVMDGLPATIRLLDPPLHEFLPHKESEMQGIANDLGVDLSVVKKRVEQLHEFNPMLGHRGCRLAITYPEIYEMQVKAIIQAALEVKKSGITVIPEIMIPLIGDVKELSILRDLSQTVAQSQLKQLGENLEYTIGTMIEVPRAALKADEVVSQAEFFSFGTNDLTQMTCGFSRDDSGSFLSEYVKKGIYKRDPFQSLDQSGVGYLVDLAVQKARQVKPDLKIGVCGEHGGDPESIKFLNGVGLDYVSCSPFRVPVARLSAAHAAILKKR